jgi:hypothetical protein
VKKLPIAVRILLVLLVTAGLGVACVFLCSTAEPPVLYINDATKARCGPSAWNWSRYSLVSSESLEYSPENTLAVPPGSMLSLRTKKAHWWGPRWRILEGSGSAVYLAGEPVNVPWTGEDTLSVPEKPGEYIAELWISYNGWLRAVFGHNRVRYSFAVNIE